MPPSGRRGGQLRAPGPDTEPETRPETGSVARQTAEGDAPALPAALAAALCPATGPALLARLPQRLDTYLSLLESWNTAINLSGAHSRAGLERLALDSFHLAAFLGQPALAVPDVPTGPRIWDFGAGAGLPGIPLRLVWEEGEYTLVEPREKRALFLANALARLELPRTRVFRGTAQQCFAAHPDGADRILARAFLPWPELLALCRPMLRPGGLVLIFASEAAGSLPAPWQLAAQTAYSVDGRERWLWALRPGDTSGDASGGTSGDTSGDTSRDARQTQDRIPHSPQEAGMRPAPGADRP